MAKLQKARILLLEDDPDLQELIASYYQPRGYEIVCHVDPTVPLQELQAARDPDAVFDLILTDLKMPNMDGMELIRKVSKLAPKVPIILMTAHSSVEVAVEAIHEGAYDFVVKPLHFPQLNVSIERALHLRTLEADNRQLRSQVQAASTRFDGVVGKSQAITAVLDMARRVASSSATVLITGESGTGKEVIAKVIHQSGSRSKGPFVAINCSAIPEHLLESELFGFAKGAFTGATDKKLGLFEEAEGGTLFLDEIGDLNLPLQAKLLRVLQERKVKRLGENVFRPVNVRVLAATHKNLEKEVREKRFREDLYFRLNVIPIRIPPLRERPEDILPLARHFVDRFAVQNDSVARALSRPAMEHLLRLPWKGNVRELENAIERAVVLCENREIGPGDLPPPPAAEPAAAEERHEAPAEALQASPPAPEHAYAAPAPRLPQAHPMEAPAGRGNLLMQVLRDGELPSLDDFVLEYVGVVLDRVGGVKERAARVLKIDRKTLYRRIEEMERARREPDGLVKSAH